MCWNKFRFDGYVFVIVVYIDTWYTIIYKL